MAGRGIQYIPLRVPEQWSKAWFETFVRDVLSKMDARNIVEGAGIEVTGNTDEPATLTADTDVSSLLAISFVVLGFSSAVSSERKLTSSASVTVIDGGAGGNVTLVVADGAVDFGNIAEFPAVSVLGRSVNSTGYSYPIEATANGQVLRRASDVVGFGAVDLADTDAVTGVLPAANVDTAIARLASPVFTGAVRLPAYTVATLPAGTVGDTAYVTDATAPTYLGALTGGGAVHCPVFRNATIWVSG